MYLVPFIFKEMIFFHRSYKLLVLGSEHTTLSQFLVSILIIAPMAEFILVSISIPRLYESLLQNQQRKYWYDDLKIKKKICSPQAAKLFDDIPRD